MPPSRPVPFFSEIPRWLAAGYALLAIVLMVALLTERRRR